MNTTLRKKQFQFVAMILVVTMFFMFAVASSESETQQNQGTGEAAQNNSGAKNNLGDYNVEIKSCRLEKDFEGKPVVIIKYGFTNNSSDPKAFWLAVDCSVYQNGVGLNEAYVLSESANYSADNQTKEIKTGVSIDVEVAYSLNDTETKIDVEVAETFSFTNDKVIKSFNIN
ncbi:MAG: DUF5067 domain-containing protein [Clostridia bacterium]|nr:DUF5067 domain-containing protein [Clostridia bacterium]